jgi:5-methylthioadenosine/S-adenosylhomocysteine deaminase
MPGAPSDTNIKVRWLVPMTGEALLAHHTLVVRDGRIVEILPDEEAARRYAPRVLLERPTHLLMPGLVNARTSCLAMSAQNPRFAPEIALLSIANMIKAGITCFCDVGYFPSDVARLALSQGLRAAIGLPVAERASPWAQNAGEYLSRALRLRDEYKGHPTLSVSFAPLRPAELADATLARLSMLVNELDAGVCLALHESERDVDESLARHGLRPIERLERLGLLTPALTAAQLQALAAQDLDLARRAGIGVTLCLASGLVRGVGLPPISALPPLRLGLGSDGDTTGAGQDLWTEIKLLALHAPAIAPGAVLAAATRGGAGALGLEAEIGTLEPGKWADLCCVDLGGPATQPLGDPLRQLVFSGARDLVSDVWVAGRQLLCEGRYTRLEWPALAERLRAGALNGDSA